MDYVGKDGPNGGNAAPDADIGVTFGKSAAYTNTPFVPQTAGYHRHSHQSIFARVLGRTRPDFSPEQVGIILQGLYSALTLYDVSKHHGHPQIIPDTGGRAKGLVRGLEIKLGFVKTGENPGNHKPIYGDPAITGKAYHNQGQPIVLEFELKEARGQEEFDGLEGVLKREGFKKQEPPKPEQKGSQQPTQPKPAA